MKGTTHLLVYLCIFISYNVFPVLCANILFVHHIASHSHRVVSYPLANALDQRGHKITFISPLLPPEFNINPNITEIRPQRVVDTQAKFLGRSIVKQRIEGTLNTNVFGGYERAVILCQELLESEEIKKFFKETKSVDLVIADECMGECGAIFVHKFKSKLITLNTVQIAPNEQDVYGLTPESSAVPEMITWSYRTPMSFLQRVRNTLISLYLRYEHYYYDLSALDSMIRKYPGFEDMPFIDDIVQNTSLVLSMTDIVTDYPRSLPPLIVNVGGLHCNNHKQGLPEDLRKFVEDPESDGFIYFSWGSFASVKDLPVQMRETILKVIQAFPKLRFLWKWNDEIPENIPKNLYLAKWFPQNDLLTHPKIRAFVTQNGRPSTIEAVCAGVPMISIPIQGDQDFNANRMSEMGGSIFVELSTLTLEGLTHAFEEVISPKVKARMTRLQQILHDQPMHPLEKAVWWTEYVLRHPNTDHLKSAGASQWWYERRLIDVYAFLYTVALAFVIAMTVLVSKISKFISKLLTTRSGKKSNIGERKKKL